MNDMSRFGISTTDLISQMRPISADSHIVEPPNCYIDRIDPKFRDIAPHVVNDPKKGDIYVIDQLTGTVPMGLIAAAGVDPAKMRIEGSRFQDLPRGGWDAKARIADQDRDGVVGEIIYPSVGMMICNHPDFDYTNACFRAYNGWLAEEFIPGAPNRVFGVGQTAARSPAEMIEDMRRIKEAGFVGVMLPGFPKEADYDSAIYDPVWRAAIELDLPLSFHVLTSRSDTTSRLMAGASRGPKVNSFQSIIRACQDIIGMFIYSGVFERHPQLKVITVEADAGWAPHYVYRMDHAFRRHRHWLDGGTTLTRMPSEYFKENVYMTFQDDWVAFKLTQFFNPRQLMWANDFPHSDSTWPNSRQLLADAAKDMSLEHLKWILHDNVAELYKLAI
jgi:predicted TIM-barrel fold metal-dependent hydrolase